MLATRGGGAWRDDADGIVMFMPHPQTSRANAVWVTAANWAEGAARRLGQCWALIPGEVLSPQEVRAVANRPSPLPTAYTERRWLPTTLRAAVKDVRLAAQRTRASRRYPTERLPACRPAFVWQHHDLFLRSGTVFARRHGLPLVQFVDAPVVWEARRWGVERRGWGALLEARGETPQLRNADIVACISREVADAVVAVGVAEDRVVVTPCTADETRFHPRGAPDPVRRRLGLAEEHFVVGWTGSFRAFHGLDQLVEAFRPLVDVIPTARLLLVGEGAQRPMIEAQIDRLGIRDQTILTGEVPHDEVPGFVRAMDVAVVTSGSNRFHYSPLKLREYLRCAVPVVAPSVGQIKETLTDGQDSLLYPPGDLGRLTSAFLQLAQTPRLRTAIGDAGYAAEVGRGGMAAQLDMVGARLAAIASPVGAQK